MRNFIKRNYDRIVLGMTILLSLSVLTSIIITDWPLHINNTKEEQVRHHCYETSLVISSVITPETKSFNQEIPLIIDVWRHRLWVEYCADVGELIIKSAGPDGKFGTDDDISVKQIVKLPN